MSRMTVIVWAMSAMCISAAARAADVSTTISLSYYECLKPASDPCCVASDESSKKTSCPDCVSWKVKRIAYSVKVTPNREYDAPNVFIHDAAKQLYGQGLPTDQNGKPIPISDFYKNYKRYGWVEVSGDSSTSGTIALLPHTAAVVVKDAPKTTEIVYSSTKRGGSVVKSDIDRLDKGDRPKYVVPKAIFAANKE